MRLTERVLHLIRQGRSQQAIEEAACFCEDTGEWGPMLEVWIALDPAGARKAMLEVEPVARVAAIHQWATQGEKRINSPWTDTPH